jgi:hypothetical protein
VNSTSHTDRLDPFETALLVELRREVAEHPAPSPGPTPPARPTRRRLRLAAVGATGIAASVVAVFGLGSTGGSPAYAVEKDGDGDVVITVHRLDDAGGLEDALQAEGIDADVSYDAGSFGPAFGTGPDGEPLPDPPPPAAGDDRGPTSAEGGTDRGRDDGEGPSLTQQGPDGQARPADPDDDPCGLGTDPATLSRQGSDWVLTIPAGSPLQDRHVAIGTDSTGALSVAYAGEEPGSMCGMVSVNRSTRG